jgi:hypothetical protein
MTQEERDLLLRDLSARLLYAPKIHIISKAVEIDDKLTPATINQIKDGDWIVKPYLRPLVSMTDEEENELKKITDQFDFDRRWNLLGVGRADDGWCNLSDMTQIIDYLISHQFDYREFIPLGLALEAKENMYKFF